MLVDVLAGTHLYRLHRSKYSALTFNPVLAHRYFDGGRFDSTADDVYAYLYAADSEQGAIAETLFRDLPIALDGTISISHTQIDDRRLTRLRIVQGFKVVDLRDLVSLRAASQDGWLTAADPSDYPQTRHWGHWIRTQAPEAGGFVWRSKRDPGRLSYVLFEERIDGAAMEVDATWRPNGIDPDFNRLEGLEYLRSILQPLAADIDYIEPRGLWLI